MENTIVLVKYNWDSYKLCRLKENAVISNNDRNNTVGITFISEGFSNSIDSFWIILNPEILINPFDFVSVDNINNTKTIGIVKELQRIFLDVDTLFKITSFSQLEHIIKGDVIKAAGVTVARIDVIATTSTNDSSKAFYSNDSKHGTSRSKSKLSSKPLVNMPVMEGKSVSFASVEEVIASLGIPEMENPIPAGVITLTNGALIPIDLDVSYIFGPDTTHVNATGISGNMKTSYLLFLLQVIYQKLSDEGIAIVLFNTKEKDLLSVDKENEDNYSNEDIDVLDLLDLELTPFTNVKYFLPRGKNGKPNSALIPEKNYLTYSFELSDVYDRLELLFSSETTYDPHYNVSSIINYIYELWPMLSNNDKNGNNLGHITNWTDLINFNDYPEEIVTHKSTLLKFQGAVQRFRKPVTLFVDKKVTSTYIGDEIRQLKKDDVFVIDIAKLPTLEEQSFVVGDVMRTIDEMYSVGYTGFSKLDNNEKNVEDMDIPDKPKYVIILLDEINRFLPHRDSINSSQGTLTSSRSAVTEEILKTLIAGKSRHSILFSAQQFKSQVDPSLNENTGLHILAKLGLSELSTSSYSMIDDITKSVITKLHKGEFVLVHPAFRHPIKITIPKPTFKRP